MISPAGLGLALKGLLAVEPSGSILVAADRWQLLALRGGCTIATLAISMSATLAITLSA